MVQVHPAPVSDPDRRTIEFYKRVNGTTGPIALTRAHLATRLIARALAAFTWRRKQGRPQSTVAGLAEEWRRMFGLDRFWKIDRIDNGTAYAEIHFPCSLEGSGDVAACHRLMEYDRALVRKMGGEFVVLESRADPSVKGCCKVAIRKTGARLDDLTPARPVRNAAAEK